jgi:hypothetical protein
MLVLDALSRLSAFRQYLAPFSTLVFVAPGPICRVGRTRRYIIDSGTVVPVMTADQCG